MKRIKEEKGNPFPRTLTDEKIKAARGGTNSLTPPPIDPGNDPTPNARAQVIEIG